MELRLGQQSHRQHTQRCFKLWVGLVRLWQGWEIKMSLVPFPGLMHLYDELTMSFYWYSYNVQFYIVAFLVKRATKLLNFAPNWGLAWYNMMRLDKKSVFHPSPKTRVPL